MKNSLAWIIIVILLIAGGIFVFADRNTNPQETQSPSWTTTPTPTPSLDSTSSLQLTRTSTPAQSPQNLVKEFIITGSNFKFDIKEIKVKKGDRIRIVLKNAGAFHDWVIDEFNAKTKQIKTGEQDTIEFVADKTGQFQYYCSVGTHRQMGMWGTLIVE